MKIIFKKQNGRRSNSTTFQNYTKKVRIIKLFSTYSRVEELINGKG